MKQYLFLCIWAIQLAFQIEQKFLFMFLKQ